MTSFRGMPLRIDPYDLDAVVTAAADTIIKALTNPCSEMSGVTPSHWTVKDVDELVVLKNDDGSIRIRFERESGIWTDPRTELERLDDELHRLKKLEQRGDRKAALERRRIEQQIKRLGVAARQQEFEERMAEKRAEEERRRQLEADELWGQF